MVVLRRLRRVRESRFVTQRELAAKAGVSHGTVVRLERGADARLVTARKLAAALAVEPSDLVGDDQPD